MAFPEKWCLKCDGGGKISQMLSQWATDNGHNGFEWLCHNTDSPYYYLSTPKATTLDNRSSIPDGFTEVTFEQFKRHFIDKNDSPTNISITKPKLKINFSI